MNKEKELTIEGFWWFNNDDCWLIKRENRADYYLYTPTMRYIYKPSWGDRRWRGTKNPFSMLQYGKEVLEKEQKKVKYFESEHDAVRWLAGDTVRTKKSE